MRPRGQGSARAARPAAASPVPAATVFDRAGAIDGPDREIEGGAAGATRRHQGEGDGENGEPYLVERWNTRDAQRVPLGCTGVSRCQNRVETLQGREAIAAFLTRKWQREVDDRLIKEIWTFRENRLAVRFAYEWHDDSGDWFRSYGNENWDFDERGLMRRPHQRSSDPGEQRKYHWRLGRRPDDHPSLSDLGL